MTIKTIEGDFTPPQDARFCLVVSRFNSFVVESLMTGAIDTLQRHGGRKRRSDLVRDARRLRDAAGCSSAWPPAGGYDAIVALGAVIRGGTPHFEYVAGECVKGMASVSA